jgi:acetyl-CoA C-acetyltransferase
VSINAAGNQSANRGGTRVVLTLINELRRRGGGVGAAALCGGGGQGDAAILKTL